MDIILYYRVKHIIKKFGEKYHKAKLNIREREVVDFYDDLSRYLAYFFNKRRGKSIDYLIKIGNLLIDETKDMNFDFIFVIPLIHLEILYIVMDEEEYSDVVEKLYDILEEDEGIYFLVDNTIGILEKSSLEDAVASSSGMLLLGIDSYFKKYPEAALKVIGYYMLLSDILSMDDEDKYIFSLISYFSLSLFLDIILDDQEFIMSLDKYGDRVFANSFVANLISSVSEDPDVENYLDKKLGDFIRVVLDKNKDKVLMRESLALRWYLYRIKKGRHAPIVDNAVRVFSASMRVLRKGSYEDIVKAEEIYKAKREAGSLTNDEKDLLAVAALELYKAGLKPSYQNIINFLHSVSSRSSDRSTYNLAEILKHIQSKDKGGQ